MKLVATTAVAVLGVLGCAAPANAEQGWTEQQVPAKDGTETLLSSTVAAGEAVWAFGGEHPEYQPPLYSSAAYVRTGEGWQAREVPNIGILNDASALAADDVWAIGQEGKVPASSSIHFDGTEWKEVPFAQGPGKSILSMDGVTAFAPDDVWAAGASSGQDVPPHGVVQHFDGHAWTEMALPEVEGDWRLSSIGGSGTDDVWVTGSITDENSFQRGVSLHWDGKSWSQHPLPDIDQPKPTADDIDFGDVAERDGEVFATATFRVYDTDVAQPHVFRWDGQEWSEVELPIEDGWLGDLVPAGDQLWALGTTPLRFDGESWQAETPPQDASLTAGVGIGDDLLGVGSKGEPGTRHPFAATHPS